MTMTDGDEQMWEVVREILAGFVPHEGIAGIPKDQAIDHMCELMAKGWLTLVEEGEGDTATLSLAATIPGEAGVLGVVE